jgi:hypothetical protein
LSERWRKPATVISIEPHDTEVLVLPDGRVQRNNVLTFDRETTERIRLGWLCAKCLEVFPEAWPEHCPVCGAPIRERQAEYFQKEFALLKDDRPSLEEEIEGIRERAEAEEAKP